VQNVNKNVELEREKEEKKKIIYDCIKQIKYNKNLDYLSKVDVLDLAYQLLLERYSCNVGQDNNIVTQQEVGRTVIIELLPVLEYIIHNADEKISQKAFLLYQNVLALASRTSFEHFIEYMEFNRPNPILPTRISVLKPFIFYLNKSMFDNKLQTICASYAPSMGKSFTVNYYTAWALGRNSDGSILRLSYSDELVLSFSRSVQDLVASERFADIFPNFKVFNGKPFDVEKVSDWKIKNTDTLTSLYSRTRDGAVTGVRAKTAIIFDDMIKDQTEATNDSLHKQLYTKWNTVWFNRKDTNNTKFVFLGTMWSPNDLLNKIREDAEKYTKLIPSKQFKYAMETEDGSAVFIRVPLLDENDKSTCEYVTSTKEAIKLRDTMDAFEFSCVYQQTPIAPTGLEFAYEELRHYDELPRDEMGNQLCPEYCFAVLDPARKGKDFVSMPICKKKDNDFYMIDVLFKQKPMTDLYDEIVDKIIQHNIILFSVENNIDVSLKTLLEDRLKAKGYVTCEIVEKYNTIKKEQRIKDQRGIIKRSILFKNKNNFTKNSDYGKFMEQFTVYSFDYANRHDDAPDSLALFTTEIILGKGKVNKAKGIDRSKICF
jgi:predicted phage terminase large subunit-like protein